MASSDRLVAVGLTCGHQRRIDAGSARMIRAGHITSQWCHPCASPKNVTKTPEHS